MAVEWYEGATSVPTFVAPLCEVVEQFHFMPDEFHLMPDKFHFMPDKFHLMPEPTFACGFGHKVKLAY